MNQASNPLLDSITELMLETFRLNGRLLAAGDALVGPIGLTSARWQVLGAIALAGEPLTVAEIARRMGLARQSVQRTADAMRAEGLVDVLDNPRHKRARLVSLTAEGQARYAVAFARHVPWATALAGGLEPPQIQSAVHVLRSIRQQLEMAPETQTPEDSDDASTPAPDCR